MNDHCSVELIKFGSVGFICLALGYFLSHDPAAIERLKAERDKYKSLASARAEPRVVMSGSRMLQRGPPGAVVSSNLAAAPIPVAASDARLKEKKRVEQEVRDAFVLETSIKRSNDYMQVFAKYGLPVAEQFRRALADIHSKSLECETAIVELSMARDGYARELEEAIGPENYADYKEYEQGRRTRRELKLLQTYLQQRQVTAIDPANVTSLATLIQQEGGYTTVAWEGPLDGLPQPIVTKDGMLEHLGSENARLGELSRRVSEWATQAELPQEVRTALEDYYSTHIQANMRRLDFLQLPKDQQLQILESRFNAVQH